MSDGPHDRPIARPALRPMRPAPRAPAPPSPPPQAPMSAPRAPGLRVRVVPFWLRTVANLIDLVPLATLYLMVLFATGLADTSELPQSRWNTFDMLVDLLNERPLFFVWPALLWFAMVGAYYLVCELTLGVSVGKRLLNFTLIDSSGERPIALMILIRNVIRLVSLALLGLGYLWALFDTERRTLHDWLSGTWLIRSRSVRPPG